MTYEELEEKIRELIPTAGIDEDNDGQLIIYTDLTVDRKGTLVPYEG